MEAIFAGSLIIVVAAVAYLFVFVASAAVWKIHGYWTKRGVAPV
jgi:hypothetical protein